MANWFQKMVFDKLIVTTVREGLGGLQKGLSDMVMSSISVHSNENIYTGLYMWLINQPLSKKFKKSRVLSLAGQRVVGPGYGKYSIWYKGVVVWVTISQEKGQGTKGFPSAEQITLSTVVPKNTVLQEIISEVTNKSEKDKK